MSSEFKCYTTVVVTMSDKLIPIYTHLYDRYTDRTYHTHVQTPSIVVFLKPVSVVDGRTHQEDQTWDRRRGWIQTLVYTSPNANILFGNGNLIDIYLPH
jgi:hypothetical protein